MERCAVRCSGALRAADAFDIQQNRPLSQKLSKNHKLLIEEAMDSKAENILYVSYYNHKNKDSTLLSTFGNLIFKYTLYKEGNNMKLQKKLLNYYQLMVSKR